MSAAEVHDGSREPASSNHELTAGSVKMITVRNVGDQARAPSVADPLAEPALRRSVASPFKVFCKAPQGCNPK